MLETTLSKNHIYSADHERASLWLLESHAIVTIQSVLLGLGFQVWVWIQHEFPATHSHLGTSTERILVSLTLGLR